MVQSEDIFCLVADVLDDILDTANPTQEYIDALWTSVLMEIRLWKIDASEHDKMLIAGTVFLIVRKLMCHHWDTRFNQTVYDLMSLTIEQEMKVIDEKEQNRFNERLLECSSELYDWINSYDVNNGLLSEEIEELVNGVDRKKKNDMEQQDENHVITTSFKYYPKGMLGVERNQRLLLFFNELKKKGVFIEINTDQQIFIDIFSGALTEKQIVWTNQAKRLNYLIHKMCELSLISWSDDKRKPKIIQMICARFKIYKKVFYEVEGQEKKQWRMEVCQLVPGNFNAKMDQEDAEIDRIIDLLIPEKMKNPQENISEGVEGIFSESQQDTLSIQEQDHEGFHPTDHQSFHQS